MPTARSDFDDGSITENTRAAYPVEFIDNALIPGIGGHPSHVVFLTADAFGVLPPIARLTPEQAMYHFMSGYTAKVAGTERGLGNEPAATFSACFGAPFLPRNPAVYAEMLGEKLRRHQATCWLVNTGWAGGAFGVGSRMELPHTRAMLTAALNGDLGRRRFRGAPGFRRCRTEGVSGRPGRKARRAGDVERPGCLRCGRRGSGRAVPKELRAVQLGGGGDPRRGADGVELHPRRLSRRFHPAPLRYSVWLRAATAVVEAERDRRSSR